jgi:hypothetical protein
MPPVRVAYGQADVPAEGTETALMAFRPGAEPMPFAGQEPEPSPFADAVRAAVRPVAEPPRAHRHAMQRLARQRRASAGTDRDAAPLPKAAMPLPKAAMPLPKPAVPLATPAVPLATPAVPLRTPAEPPPATPAVPPPATPAVPLPTPATPPPATPAVPLPTPATPAVALPTPAAPAVPLRTPAAPPPAQPAMPSAKPAVLPRGTGRRLDSREGEGQAMASDLAGWASGELPGQASRRPASWSAAAGQAIADAESAIVETSRDNVI